MTTIDCESQCQARYYDSHYAGITPATERIIYNQLPSTDRHNIIDVMKIPQQLKTKDCGLFAIAIATVLASGLDPTEIVFHQGD